MLQTITTVIIIMTKLLRYFTVFAIGGLSYAAIELMWRGRTHWSMVAAGGVCMLLMFEIFGSYQNLSLLKRAIIGACVITIVEFAFGCVLNYWLKMNIWDYSNKRFNLLGQICPMYTVLWGLLSLPVSVLCVRLKNWFDAISL